MFILFDFLKYIRTFFIFKKYTDIIKVLGKFYNNITNTRSDGNDKTEADKKRLENIVSASGLKEVTDKLDKGLETLVYRDFDDAGFTPSGGEGQKIAIARAAYKNAPIVILDEPTAALDPKAENKIYEQFDSFFADKCSLYISHRMAVTKFSDRTLVFDNAQIVQDGNHESLMNQEGKYKELYSLQAKYYTDEVNSQ